MLGSIGRLLAASSFGPAVSSRGHTVAAPAAPSFSAGDIVTAKAHRPPSTPSMLHASHRGRGDAVSRC